MATRDWKREYQMQIKRGEDKDQIERQRARRMYDKKGIDRTGKDIDHKTPLRKGGKSTGGNLRLRSRKANRGDNKV
jgi:hypothetical protein